MALAAWRVLGCRDGGRVDIRCDAQGRPQFLEVNPLPGLHPQHSDLPILCGFVGIPYVDLIDRIVRSARRTNHRGNVACTAADCKRRSAILHPCVLPSSTTPCPTTPRRKIRTRWSRSRRSRRRLARLGHEPARVSCTLDLAAMCDELRQLRPDVVFNLVESLAECRFAGLSAAGGAGRAGPALYRQPHRIALPDHAQTAGQAADAAGRTAHARLDRKQRSHPLNDTEQSRPISHRLRCPSCSSWIIKGVWDQGSRGMEDDAVLAGRRPGRGCASVCRSGPQRSGRPCFAEQFIDGREFNLSLLAGPQGPRCMPPAEIDFSAFPPGKPRIVGHRAKWQDDSFRVSPHAPPLRFRAVRRDRCWIELRQLGRAVLDVVRAPRLGPGRFSGRCRRAAVDSGGQRQSLPLARRRLRRGAAAGLHLRSTTAIQRILEDSA